MPKWSPLQLREDFDALVKALKRHHPALYRYCEPAVLDRCVDSLRATLDRPLTEFELLGRITALYPLLGDGHTIFLPTEEWSESAPARYFPLNVAFSATSLHVRCDNDRPDQPNAGSKILSINDIPADAIIDTMLTRQIRDGRHTSYAIWVLNNWFRSYFRFSFGEPERFRVLLEVDGEQKELEVNAMDAGALLPPCPPEPDETFELSLLADSIALLRIGSFARSDLKPQAIDAAFAMIRQRGIDHLVLDLRGNQGGEPRIAKRLLAHLLDHPFSLVAKGPSKGVSLPVRDTYTGALCTLMDGGSFSAAAMVLVQLELHARGILIGEESGGNRTVVSGSVRTLHLPNTRIACTISRKDWWLVERGIDGHGVRPTHAVAAEVAMPWRRDVALEKAIELLRLR